MTSTFPRHFTFRGRTALRPCTALASLINGIKDGTVRVRVDGTWRTAHGGTIRATEPWETGETGLAGVQVSMGANGTNREQRNLRTFLTNDVRSLIFTS